MCSSNLFVSQRQCWLAAAASSQPPLAHCASTSALCPSEMWTSHVTIARIRLHRKVSSYASGAKTTWGCKQNQPLNGCRCPRLMQNIIAVRAWGRVGVFFRLKACCHSIQEWSQHSFEQQALLPAHVCTHTHADDAIGATSDTDVALCLI